jgi:hypothetical protein
MSRSARPAHPAVTLFAAALLATALTVSAGETFTEALMGCAPATTRIGSTSQGVFSNDMERNLPNGWTFALGNEESLAQHQDSALGMAW